MSTKPSKHLETFENPHPGRDYSIYFECEEFTCLCPKTGQPDFATISINYIPNKLCVELKSLKLYLWSFRDQGGFHEDVTNQIMNALIEVCEPKELAVEADFKIRGGIHTVITCQYP